jgi:hypothetical protein
MEVRLSETRLKRVCEHYYQLKLLSRRLRVFAYAMDDAIEHTPEGAQRIFKLRVAAYSQTWKDPKTATKIWQEHGEDLKLDRGNASKALRSLLGQCITRVPYEPCLNHPQWGRKAKKNMPSGRSPEYGYRSTVPVSKIDKEVLLKRLVEDLPILRKTGVVEEFCQSLADFVISSGPNLFDILERQANTFPEGVIAKAIEPYVRTKEWEKTKMTARKFFSSRKKDLKSALSSRLDGLIDIICNAQN